MHSISFGRRGQLRSWGVWFLFSGACAGNVGLVGCSGKVTGEPSETAGKGGGAGKGGARGSGVAGARTHAGSSGAGSSATGGTSDADTAGMSGDGGEAGSNESSIGGTAGAGATGSAGMAGAHAGAGTAHGGTGGGGIAGASGTAGDPTPGGSAGSAYGGTTGAAGSFAGGVGGVGGVGGAGGAGGASGASGGCSSIGGAAPDWQTFQGNPAHNGYVPATLNPSCFARVWEWKREPGGGLGFINSVATEAGKVFVTDDVYSSNAYLYALNEQDGSLAFRHDFGNVPALNPPAVLNGMVYTATTGHAQTMLRAFRASDGGLVFSSPFDTQWNHLLAPTASGTRVFTNGGHYGGSVYAFDANNGSPFWTRTAGHDDMSTPAVDDKYVYHYSGIGLEVYGVSDGVSVAAIPDLSADQEYSYHGAPILGSTDNIIAFSGGAFSGRAAASVEQYGSRWLVNFSLQNVAIRWRSQYSYLTQPAVAKGVVYAGRSGPVLDALSEATGEILWSWPAPSIEGEFHRNIVVTDNLLFASTNSAVHAIDLQTRRPVWSYPAPGMLAISARKMLYIVEGAREPTGRLIAIKLN